MRCVAGVIGGVIGIAMALLLIYQTIDGVVVSVYMLMKHPLRERSLPT